MSLAVTHSNSAPLWGDFLQRGEHWDFAHSCKSNSYKTLGADSLSAASVCERHLETEAVGSASWWLRGSCMQTFIHTLNEGVPFRLRPSEKQNEPSMSSHTTTLHYSQSIRVYISMSIDTFLKSSEVVCTDLQLQKFFHLISYFCMAERVWHAVTVLLLSSFGSLFWLWKLSLFAAVVHTYW